MHRTLLLPFLATVFFSVEHLYEQHKASQVQQRWVIPIVAVLWSAWLLAVIGFASRYWSRGDSDTPGGASKNHLGLDQMVLLGRRYTIAKFRFGEEESMVSSVSGGSLSMGILGILSGFSACICSIYHIYDSQLEFTKVFILCTITALLWLIALVSYGIIMPHYIMSMHFDFGYSYWFVTCAGIIFILPLLLAVSWKVYVRAKHTTREERIMAIPTVLATPRHSIHLVCNW